MADVNPRPHTAMLRSNGASPVTETDGELLDFVEALFFAYRDFTGEADMLLAEHGFGRAHHRVLHFVHHYPGLRVIDLLEILKITKQSLARVLKGLIDSGFVEQRAGQIDRRERRLFTTARGRTMASQLARLQTSRIAHALAGASEAERQTVRRFLRAVTDEAERRRMEIMLSARRPALKSSARA